MLFSSCQYDDEEANGNVGGGRNYPESIGGGSIEDDGNTEATKNIAVKKIIPLDISIDDKTVWRTQGNAGYWGTCGQVTITNTLNIILGTKYSEQDLVSHTHGAGLMDALTGGMTLGDMVQAYVDMLPNDNYWVFGYGDSCAPSIADIVRKIEAGRVLNVSVYGDMMRNGGHENEGNVWSDHWITVYDVVYDDDGEVYCFMIVDSSSDMEYLLVEDLEKCYIGHSGTIIGDRCCIEIMLTE